MDAQLFDISYLNLFTGLFVVVLLAGLLVRFWLAGRQMRHVAWRREHVPEAFAGVISRGLSRPRARRGSQNFDRGLRAIAASHATAR